MLHAPRMPGYERRGCEAGSERVQGSAYGRDVLRKQAGSGRHLFRHSGAARKERGQPRNDEVGELPDSGLFLLRSRNDHTH